MQVDVDAPGEGVGHHQGRRGQVVGAHLARDPALEVAVAGEDGNGDQLVFGDRGRGRGRQRPAVADAGRAAVAHGVEAELLQVGGQAGLGQVVGDDLGPRRQARLHPRPGPQTGLDGVSRQQPGRQHDGRVRGVRAARDGGDDHGTVRDLGPLAGVRGIGRRRGVVARAVAVVAVEHRQAAAGRELRQLAEEGVLHAGEGNPVLGPPRSGQRRLDGGQVELQRVAVLGLRRVRTVEEPLLAAVRLDQFHLRLAAPGEPEVVDGGAVDREDAAGGAVLGRHVRDRRPVGQPELGEPGAEELDELADDSVVAQHLRDPQHEVGGRRALRQAADQAEADDLGHQHGDRLAEHGRLRLDAAHAPAQDAQAVDHRRVGVGADERVGVGEGRLGMAVRRVHDAARQVLQVDLVDDARRRRHDAEVLEGRLPPAQEQVALLVALELALRVDQERRRRTVLVDLDRMVDDEFGRLQRVDLRRVAAHRRHRVPHGGQVGHRGNAGEVLEQHPAGHERDLDVRFRPGFPAGHGLDVRGRNAAAVLPPEQVLQQDLQGVGQALHRQAGGAQGRQVGDPEGPVRDGHRSDRAEAVRHGWLVTS